MTDRQRLLVWIQVWAALVGANVVAVIAAVVTHRWLGLPFSLLGLVAAEWCRRATRHTLDREVPR